MESLPLASRLEGRKIGKWHVIEKRKKSEEDNSGYFSSCYTVRDEEGNLAFLKAYNYLYAFGGRGNSADILRFMTENFTYERDLLIFCREHKMKRIVTAIDSGDYGEAGESFNVPYLVFEIAKGNLKSDKTIKNPDLAWKLAAFHGALVGLKQLHQAKIVHQDIKPSNILIFGKDFSKLADLGSATKYGNPSNWFQDGHAGDQRYAPIELLYGYYSTDWDTRRCGADYFMMGGILTFMLTGANFLGLMISKIPENKHFKNFGGTFEEVKPFLLKAYAETLNDIEKVIPDLIRQELIMILSELTHPIPEERGNPSLARKVHLQFSLQRYITLIDKISKQAKYNKI